MTLTLAITSTKEQTISKKTVDTDEAHHPKMQEKLTFLLFLRYIRSSSGLCQLPVIGVGKQTDGVRPVTFLTFKQRL
jgi:hypothetical protein